MTEPERLRESPVEFTDSGHDPVCPSQKPLKPGKACTSCAAIAAAREDEQDRRWGAMVHAWTRGRESMQKEAIAAAKSVPCMSGRGEANKRYRPAGDVKDDIVQAIRRITPDKGQPE